MYGGMGMPKSEEVVAVYHLHAANCTDIARRTSDPKNRLVLLQMAAAWLKLAEQVEKNIQVSLVYETPEPRQQVVQQQQQENNPDPTVPKARISDERGSTGF